MPAQTLLYRVRLLFGKPLDGTVFHILNLRHATAALRAADAAPLRTLLSSAVRPENSGGLGADALQLCEQFERDLELAQRQYVEECLGGHVKDLVAYVSRAAGLAAAGRAPEEYAVELGDAAKARVRGLLAACCCSAWA